MHLHLGADISTPTIAAELSQEEFTQGTSKPWFEDTLDALLKQRSADLTTHDEGGYALRFLFRTIGRRPTARHDQYLRPVIDMLDWLSVRKETDDTTMHQFVIGSDRESDERLPLGMVLSWPESDEERVAPIVTDVMRTVARDLKYHRSFRDKETFNQSVYAYIDRNGIRSYRGVSLQSDSKDSASIEIIGDEYDPEEDTFRLECHNIYKYKQLLVCLAGAVAITQADKVLQHGSTVSTS